MAMNPPSPTVPLSQLKIAGKFRIPHKVVASVDTSRYYYKSPLNNEVPKKASGESHSPKNAPDGGSRNRKDEIGISRKHTGRIEKYRTYDRTNHGQNLVSKMIDAHILLAKTVAGGYKRPQQIVRHGQKRHIGNGQRRTCYACGRPGHLQYGCPYKGNCERLTENETLSDVNKNKGETTAETNENVTDGEKCTKSVQPMET